MKSLQKKQEILNRLDQISVKDGKWKTGRTFSLVYHLSNEHTAFIKKAYEKFFHHNGLNPGVFPSLQVFERDVLKFVSRMFHGGDFAAGTMTSGGSESLMMAVKTARDYYRQHKPQITKPEMIVAKSVHPAVDKAAQYFGVKLIKVGLDVDYKMDLNQVKKSINDQTIMIVGSATSYPQGVLDPIEELSQICLEKDLWLHVDACLGGFFLPFLKETGSSLPKFDFLVDGVKSISADVHKYGFAAKGASVIMYRSKQLRQYQFFYCTDWNGGLFASPSMTGTRPGGSIAAAWATLEAIGWDGYLELAHKLRKVTKAYQDFLVSEGCEIIGKPVGPVFSFKTAAGDTFALGDQMEARHWHMDRQNHPDSLHMMLTPNHLKSLKDFKKDFKESMAVLKQQPNLSQSGKAAMYGMVAQVVNPQQLEGFLVQYMDQRYEG